MPKELSKKDKKIKAMMEKTLASPGGTFYGRYRRVYSLLPSDPRCTACMGPFVRKGDRFITSFYKKKRSIYCLPTSADQRRWQKA
jgi:hypothetical protein